MSEAPDEQNNTSDRRPMPAHLVLTSGLLMGTADAVPGVSGGTIALILGVYEQLIASLATVVKFWKYLGDADGRAQLGAAFRFLVPLGVGAVVAYYVATKLLVGPEEDPGWIRRADTAPLCYAFFFGLVLASLREPWRRIKDHGAGNVVAALIGAVVAFVFVGLPHARSEPQTWMLLYGGALAISVMLLPGISGSLLLLILGQYTTVVGAIHDRKIGIIAVVAAGVFLGIGLFVPLLRTLLKRHHDRTMAVLTGLMAGSLRALWPWKSNYEPKAGEMSNIEPFGSITGVVVAVVLGGLAVLLLALLERRIERAREAAASA